MKKLFTFIGIMLIGLGLKAATRINGKDYDTLWNPFGGHLQYSTAIDSNTITGSGGITVTTTTAGVNINGSGAGGGGSSSLAVSKSGVLVSSPTAVINFIGSNVAVALTGGATAQVTISGTSPGGANTNVQFSSNSTFGGNNGFQYDSSVSSITLGGKFGAAVNSTSLLYDDSNGSGDPLLTLDDENGTPGGGLKFINQGVLSASWTNNTSEWDMAVSSGNSLSATNRMIFPKSDQNIKFLNASGSTYAEFNQLSNGVRNAEVITSSGTGQNLNIQVQGLPSGGHQNQIGGVTINNPDQNVPKALLVLVDSSTDQTSGDGLLELWENNPNHNSYLMWIHGDSNRNSDEPIRFDGPTYGIDEVSSSTDAAHGKGKWKVISIGNHETDLQIASPRAYDNTTFEQLLTASPFSITSKPPGMYVNHSTLADDFGVLTSSDTGAVGFLGLNDSFVALTGPKLPAGSWSFSLPSTPNNAGQVLYQADNGRGGNNNARSWEFTTGGSTGKVLTYQSGSAPTWTTATGGSSIYNSTSTAGFPFGASFSTLTINNQSLFDANGNLGLQATSVTSGYSLQLNALSGGKLMVMGGVDAVGHTSNPLGVAWILSNLSSNNKQLTFFDEEQVGDGTKWGFRYILGFGLPMIDCVNGQINTRGNFTLGYTDENVGIGFDVATAVQTDVKAKLHVKTTNTSDTGLIVQAASGETVDVIESQDSSGNPKWGVDKNGYPFPPSRTKAQLSTDVPSKAGVEAYCSDCSTDGIVVSTGTAAGAWGRISARTTAIN